MRQPALAGAVWALQLLLLAVAVLWALYLAAANIVLATGLPKGWLRRDPDLRALEYDSAWTLLPGRIHVRGFAVASLGSTPWLLEIPDGEVSVELGELFDSKLHITRLLGDDAVLRIRTPLEDPADWDGPRARAMPPIRGYSDATRPMGPEKPPEYEVDERWTTHIEGIDGTLRELWIQEYRYVGAMRVRGAFYIRPERLVFVAPARVDVLGGELHVAQHRIATGVYGDVDVALAPFDPRGIGRDVLRYLSGRLRSSAEVESAEVFNFYLGDESPLRVSDGSGAVDWDLQVANGVVLPDSWLDARTKRIDLRTPSLTAVTEARLHVDVPEPGKLRFALDSPLGQLFRPRVDRKPPTVHDARLAVELPADLAGPLDRIDTRAEVGRVSVPDLAWLQGEDAAEPSAAPKLVGGAAEGSAHLRIDEAGHATGNASLAFEQAVVRWGGVDIAGWAKGTATLEEASLAKKSVVLRSQLEVRDAAIKDGDDVWPGWWSSIAVDRLELAASPFRMRMLFRTRARDAKPVVEILESRGAVPAWVERFVQHGASTAKGELRIAPSDLDFTLVEAKSGGISAAGRIHKKGRRSTGAFLIDGGALSVGVELEGDGTSLRPLADQDWLDEKLGRKARR